MLKKVEFAVLFFAFPLTVFAAAPFTDFKSFVDYLITSLLNPLIQITFTLIFVYFFYGVAKYIWYSSTGDMQKRKEGYHLLVNGTIAIAIAASIWGIVSFLKYAFGV